MYVFDENVAASGMEIYNNHSFHCGHRSALAKQGEICNGFGTLSPHSSIKMAAAVRTSGGHPAEAVKFVNFRESRIIALNLNRNLNTIINHYCSSCLPDDEISDHNSRPTEAVGSVGGDVLIRFQLITTNVNGCAIGRLSEASDPKPSGDELTN